MPVSTADNTLPQHALAAHVRGAQAPNHIVCHNSLQRSLIEQEMSLEKYIAIPKEVLEVYKLWR